MNRAVQAVAIPLRIWDGHRPSAVPASAGVAVAGVRVPSAEQNGTLSLFEVSHFGIQLPGVAHTIAAHPPKTGGGWDTLFVGSLTKSKAKG